MNLDAILTTAETESILLSVGGEVEREDKQRLLAEREVLLSLLEMVEGHAEVYANKVIYCANCCQIKEARVYIGVFDVIPDGDIIMPHKDYCVYLLIAQALQKAGRIKP